MKIRVVILLLISSMAQAVGSVQQLPQKTTAYCKLSYVDSFDGKKGVYQGQCKDDVPHGSGTIAFSNGDKVAGSFRNGVLEGGGIASSAAGDVYQGGWINGKRHGQGEYVWRQGSRYVGQWIDDKRHGLGVLTWPNGDRFKGEFRNNKRFSGKYYTHSGRVYSCRNGQCM